MSLTSLSRARTDVAEELALLNAQLAELQEELISAPPGEAKVELRRMVDEFEEDFVAPKRDELNTLTMVIRDEEDSEESIVEQAPSGQSPDDEEEIVRVKNANKLLLQDVMESQKEILTLREELAAVKIKDELNDEIVLEPNAPQPRLAPEAILEELRTEIINLQETPVDIVLGEDALAATGLYLVTDRHNPRVP